MGERRQPHHHTALETWQEVPRALHEPPVSRWTGGALFGHAGKHHHLVRAPPLSHRLSGTLTWAGAAAMRCCGAAGASWMVYRLSLLPSAEADTAMLPPTRPPAACLCCSLRAMSCELACSQAVRVQMHGACKGPTWTGAPSWSGCPWFGRHRPHADASTVNLQSVPGSAEWVHHAHVMSVNRSCGARSETMHSRWTTR